LRGANLIGSDLYEADLARALIADKDRQRQSSRAPATTQGLPSEMGTALFRLGESRTRQDGWRRCRAQADFTDAMMKGCRLARANLRQACLSRAPTSKAADLSGCNLTGGRPRRRNSHWARDWSWR